MTWRIWLAATVHVTTAAAIAATGVVCCGLAAFGVWHHAGRGWTACTVLVGLVLIGVAAAGADIVVGPARFDPATWRWAGWAAGVAGAVLAAPVVALVGDRLQWADPRAAALTVLAGGVPAMALNALRWHGVWRRRTRVAPSSPQSPPPPPPLPAL